MAVFVEQPLALPGSAKYTVYRKFTTKKNILIWPCYTRLDMEALDSSNNYLLFILMFSYLTFV